MSEDNNLTNNSQSSFEEIRRKKVENFRMHIDTSSPSETNSELYDDFDDTGNSALGSESGRKYENARGQHKTGSYFKIADDIDEVSLSDFESKSHQGSQGNKRNNNPAKKNSLLKGPPYDSKKRNKPNKPNASRNSGKSQTYRKVSEAKSTSKPIDKRNAGAKPASEQYKGNNSISAPAVNQSAAKQEAAARNRSVDVVSDIHGVLDKGFERGAFSYDERHTKKQIRILKRKEKRRQKKNKRFFRLIWLAATLVMGIILAQFFLLGFNDMLAVKRTTDTAVHIEIGPDPTLDEIAQILQENKVIDSQLFFKLYVQMTNAGDGFRQGSFDIRTNMDYEQIVNYMQSNLNRTDVVTVQLYEGMNVLEIADKLEEEGVLTDRDKFFELLNSDKFDEDFPFLENVSSEGKYYRLEGYLFPDTYDFYVNEDPETTIWRFLDNFERRIVYTEYEDEHYEKDVTIEQMIEDSEYSMDDIIIIASIIQAEAANTEDMYYVSSVLHNRLNSHIDEGLSRLECDSTVYYPYRSKSSVPDNMEDYVSRYNTYSIYGLPAGAICNPSLDAIKAALYPYSTDYYYFCHSAATEDSPSVSYYATNYDDHYNNLIAAGLVEQ